MKSNSWIRSSFLIPISLLEFLSHNHVTQCHALGRRENLLISLDSTIKSRCLNGRCPISTSNAPRPIRPDNAPNDESERFLTAIRGGATSSKDRDANQSNANANVNLVARTRRQKLVVLLVTTALFNDMLQLTMLLPIIHTLITSPPPLGVATSLHGNNNNNNNNNNAQVLLGIFFASKDICQMSFAPLAGLLTARTSSHFSLLLSLLGLALATLLFADATTFRRLLLARAAQGAASAAVLCGGMSLIAETHEGRLRGRAMGAAQTGLALGLLCGPLIGGLAFERLGRVRTFRVAAGILGANALGMVGLMGWGSGSRWGWASEEDMIKGVVVTTTTATNEKERSVRSLLENTKALLANRDVLAVSLATLTIHAAVGVIKPISQVVLDEEFGVTMVNRSFIISIATVAYFLITPIAGYWCDASYGTDDETSRVARRSNLVAWSLLLMFGSCGFFGLRYWMGIWAFYISVGLLGVALGLFKCSSSSLLADLVDRHKARKRNNGALGSEGEGEYSMVYALADVSDSLGLIVGPIAGLYLSQLYGPSVGVIAIGSLSLMLAPILMKIA